MAFAPPQLLPIKWRMMAIETNVYDQLKHWKGVRKQRIYDLLDNVLNTLKLLKANYNPDEARQLRVKCRKICYELFFWKSIINAEIERGANVYIKRYTEMKSDVELAADDDDRSADVWRLQTLGKAPSVHDPDQFLIDLEDEEDMRRS